jgi:hypothetical protein
VGCHFWHFIAKLGLSPLAASLISYRFCSKFNVGLAALGAHFCLNHAMQHAEVSMVAMSDFLRRLLVGAH